MMLDDSSMRISIHLLNKLKNNDPITAEEISEYFNSPGIQFLREHCKRCGGSNINEKVLSDIMEQPEKYGAFGRAVQAGLQRLNQAEEIINIDISAMEKEVKERVQKYSLIDVSQIEVKIYLLYGMRGTAIVLPERGMAIDMCDSAIYTDNHIDLERVKDTLAHEYHHIILDYHIDQMYGNNQSEKQMIIRGLIGEGMAYEFFTPWMVEGEYATTWARNYENIEEKIDTLELQLCQEITPQQIEALDNQLFGSGLLGYTLGYYMIQQIHKKFGLNAVLDLMNTLNIFEIYHQSRLL